MNIFWGCINQIQAIRRTCDFFFLLSNIFHEKTIFVMVTLTYLFYGLPFLIYENSAKIQFAFYDLKHQ